MRQFNKHFMVAAFAAALGGVSVGAMAQPAGPGSVAPDTKQDGQTGMHRWHHEHRHADPAAYLGTLKAEVGIRADQAAVWDAYAKAVLDAHAQRQAERHAAHTGPDKAAMQAMSPHDRAAFLVNRMELRDRSQAAVKGAAKTLLASLDDTQKVTALSRLPGLAIHGGWHGGEKHDGMMHGSPDRGAR